MRCWQNSHIYWEAPRSTLCFLYNVSESIYEYYIPMALQLKLAVTQLQTSASFPWNLLLPATLKFANLFLTVCCPGFCTPSVRNLGSLLRQFSVRIAIKSFLQTTENGPIFPASTLGKWLDMLKKILYLRNKYYFPRGKRKINSYMLRFLNFGNHLFKTSYGVSFFNL